METIAYGVLADERTSLERAFDRVVGDGHRLRCLELPLTPDTAPAAAGCGAVLSSVNDQLGAEVLRRLAGGGTRLIAQRSTGYNNIDLRTAEECGLSVARVSHYSPYAVAEFAWALAMAVDRHLVRAAVRARDFDFRLDGLLGHDFHGRTAGVLGTGKIGSVFARIAHGYGMRLLGHDLEEDAGCRALGMQYVSRERLFAEADLISLHLPLTPGTHHLVDAGALRRMKDDVLLVNTGRGGLVDTEALLAALRAGRLRGVGLDVYEEEARWFHADWSMGVMTDDALARLMTFNNVLVTSHQGYFTRDAVEQIAEATARNVRDHLDGRTSENTLVPAHVPA
ncbi:2-hydroxyacid dehydrogenase [Streptomyces sp. JJ36]|uniref:2-hydroxyacid dehydrogenase n=1 Tax=Streptomyces sp. JJ36 TaxID=2736645 RepID=UPI001F1ACBA9|nr:2-hydroxyacid dehydrogenase [Streptomyces sp. JJ36]MCF6525765.1 2-hydroxyacid dehydrogenase [Streptomyces sp. JJ36]